MNKKLIESKIKSIEHYNKQILDLEETLKMNREIVDENLQKLAEYFPFEKRDVVAFKGSTFFQRVIGLDTKRPITQNSDGIFFEVMVETPSGSTSWREEAYSKSWRLNDVLFENKYRKLNF